MELGGSGHTCRGIAAPVVGRDSNPGGAPAHVSPCAGRMSKVALVHVVFCCDRALPAPRDRHCYSYTVSLLIRINTGALQGIIVPAVPKFAQVNGTFDSRRDIATKAKMEPDHLDAWIERQTRASIKGIQRSISATHLVRRREAFGQTIRPAKGSVLASPVIANWDPEPDYFFHWVRDSAIVMRSVADLMQDAADADERTRWRRHFDDFVRFSLVLNATDGAEFLARNRYRETTRRGFRKFLRREAEISRLRGDRVLGEPNFNPDGTINIQRWSRPQYDGPALRALACLRYLDAGGPASEELSLLLNLDLRFTLDHAGRRCIGPWEEAGWNTHHYYVALVQFGALVHGRAFAGPLEPAWASAEARLRRSLERHWSEPHQVYTATWPAHGKTADEVIDAAALIAVLDADLPGGAHSVQDPRVHCTQEAIEDLFARLFPINQRRGEKHAPALGRWRDDRYFGGGAWYPTTLAAATLYYRRAQRPAADGVMLVRRGEAFMATVRDLTPADGALSEQVNRATGAQTSARHLAWSYAAFLVAARTRRQALRITRQQG